MPSRDLVFRPNKPVLEVLLFFSAPSFLSLLPLPSQLIPHDSRLQISQYNTFIILEAATMHRSPMRSSGMRNSRKNSAMPPDNIYAASAPLAKKSGRSSPYKLDNNDKQGNWEVTGSLEAPESIVPRNGLQVPPTLMSRSRSRTVSGAGPGTAWQSGNGKCSETGLLDADNVHGNVNRMRSNSASQTEGTNSNAGTAVSLRRKVSWGRTKRDTGRAPYAVGARAGLGVSLDHELSNNCEGFDEDELDNGRQPYTEAHFRSKSPVSKAKYSGVHGHQISEDLKYRPEFQEGEQCSISFGVVS
jgi:hypothetical protein